MLTSSFKRLLAANEVWLYGIEGRIKVDEENSDK